MKRLLSILLLFLSIGAIAQTYDTLPTGSKPYGNQLYLTPTGLVVGGIGSSKFRVLGTKKYVDSLLALKADISALTNYVTKTGTETLTNKTLMAPDITNGTINNAVIGNGSINSTPIGAVSPNTGTFTTLNATVGSSTLQLLNQKGQANGYPSLDGFGKVPISQIPNLSVYARKKYVDSITGTRETPGQGLWIMSSFRNNDNRLYLQLSNNGKTWKPLDINSSYTAPSGNEVRDPSILFWNNLYYITHSGGFFGGATYAPVVRSGNLQDWDLLLNVNTNTTVDGVPSVATWAPEWFVDTAGKKLPALIYTTNPGNSTHTPFYSQALDVDLLTWSSPTRITGTSMPNMIDLQIIYKGGFYYLWYKNEATKYIEIMRSTSPYSGYTSYKTGDWAGFGANVEGVSVEMIQPGIWRVYMDAYGAGTGIEYFDSIDDWNSWIPFGGIQSTIITRHGTVRYTSSLNVLRNAVNYYVSKDIVTLQTAVDNGNEVYSSSDRSINLRRATVSTANGLTWATGINSTFFLGQREIDNDYHLYNFGANSDAFKIGFNTNLFSLMSLAGTGNRPVAAASDGALIDGTDAVTAIADAKVKNNLNPSTTSAPSATAVSDALALKPNLKGDNTFSDGNMVVGGNLETSGSLAIGNDIIATANGSIFRYQHRKDTLLIGGYMGGINFDALEITADSTTGQHIKALIAPTQTNDILRLGDVSSMIDSHSSSGTYTPTITGIANVTGTSNSSAHYKRIDKEVTVYGSIQITTTSNVATTFTISLPLNSDFSSDNDAIGLGTIDNTNVASPGQIRADTVKDVVSYTFGVNAVNLLSSIKYSFTYTIK